MNPEVLEIFRNNLLIQLSGASTMGLTRKTLQLGATIAGIPADEASTRNEVQYLVDGGLAVEVQKTLSPENARYRITKPGRDYLATQNLA